MKKKIVVMIEKNFHDDFSTYSLLIWNGLERISTSFTHVEYEKDLESIISFKKMNPLFPI